LIEKFENKQAGMAFVHVEAIQSVVSKRAQHSYSADAENDLLAQPIIVAAVKKMRQHAIVVDVFRQVCIEEINRCPVATDAVNLVSPAAELKLILRNCRRTPDIKDRGKDQQFHEHSETPPLNVAK
jgi:hypothetical protein